MFSGVVTDVRVIRALFKDAIPTTELINGVSDKS
jgi:hypothetical protein